MSWTVTWEPSAVNATVRFLEERPDTLDEVFAASDMLAEDPKPAGSTPWGTSHRRLRVGRWRLLYRIDDANRILHIEHVGFTA
ncbi:type II toxin-antitoxin system RelE/ParE family toxin [Streptomyces sp. NBC_01474]|uniref:type II toxin-antitoxin system RelE family toxin n=1 Tax=unclassified Streptomyces TaxID=2593676 RepID=UPI002DDA5C3E|nr:MULTISPECIES: type II toxin-antitoxin system RelE/ParE family toxin [unclassified Streptomyces]WSD92947.1 type II toxin-antitoxin system RelE/ParE family toxin [Streptomyces sp. NBC_01474]